MQKNIRNKSVCKILSLLLISSLMSCKNVDSDIYDCQEKSSHPIISAINNAALWAKENDAYFFRNFGLEEDSQAMIRFWREMVVPQIDQSKSCDFIAFWHSLCWQGALVLNGRNLLYFEQKLSFPCENEVQKETHLILHKVLLSDEEVGQMRTLLSPSQTAAEDMQNAFWCEDGEVFCYVFRVSEQHYSAKFNGGPPFLDESPFGRAIYRVFKKSAELLEKAIPKADSWRPYFMNGYVEDFPEGL